MTTSPWPYAGYNDERWLRPPGVSDPELDAAREAVRSVVPLGTVESPQALPSVISAVVELAERLDWALLSLVGEARAAGISWEAISDGLGVTKQAAHKRFSPYVQAALQRARDAVAEPELSALAG